MQTKKQSMIESLVNVSVGYAVAVASQVAIFPVFGIHISVNSNLAIGAFFTVVSVVRSYVLRRIFNRFR